MFHGGREAATGLLSETPERELPMIFPAMYTLSFFLCSFFFLMHFLRFLLCISEQSELQYFHTEEDHVIWLGSCKDFPLFNLRELSFRISLWAWFAG